MKFEMNKETLWTLKTDENTFLTNTGVVERKYSLLGYPVVINTNKPDGIVQLGRDSIDLNYTDNIRASLESLVYVAKRRELMDSESVPPQMMGRGLRRSEGGRINFGPDGNYNIPVTKEEDEVVNSMTRDSEVSLRHCQAVKDWKKRNIGGSYTPSEEDVDELIEIVVSHLPKRVDVEGVKGRFWCMGSTTRNMINNHPEIFRHNIKVNRISGLPIHIDETIERGVIKLSGDDREVIFNPKQPTLNTLKSELQEILNHVK
ncbi:hypothetical protein [Vibrio phage Artemius]|nr:hypothetical protein [Vibrio phage Artemius]